jgi:hypothetical protein
VSGTSGYLCACLDTRRILSHVPVVNLTGGVLTCITFSHEPAVYALLTCKSRLLLAHGRTCCPRQLFANIFEAIAVLTEVQYRSY